MVKNMKPTDAPDRGQEKAPGGMGEEAQATGRQSSLKLKGQLRAFLALLPSETECAGGSRGPAEPCSGDKGGCHEGCARHLV